MTPGRAEAPVVILGAGPYGLACAAFLLHAGVPVRVFGRPMSSWGADMPHGMWLRSRRRSAHIADPGLGLSLEDYEAATGAQVPEPIPVEDYAEYGRWFARTAVPDIDPREVTRIEAGSPGFRLTLDDGEVIEASRVVVASGLKPFPRRPEPFAGLPPALVSHTSEHPNLAELAGRRVVVIGSGQSALEYAALLHEAGAETEVLGRTETIRWLPGTGSTRPGDRLRRMIVPPTDVGGRVTGWMAAAPGVLSRLPPGLREPVIRRCTVPAGASWLPGRLADVPITLGRSVLEARAQGDGVRLELDDGSAREVDHVLLGTGFELDLSKLGFLPPELVDRIETEAGYPRLTPGCESTVPGLHFVGAAATVSLGPLMRHVVGTWYVGPALVAVTRGKSPPVALLSYKPRSRLLAAAR